MYGQCVCPKEPGGVIYSRHGRCGTCGGDIVPTVSPDTLPFPTAKRDPLEDLRPRKLPDSVTGYKPLAATGLKFDDDKVRMDLLCPIAMEELAKVLTFGAKKYSAWNWAKGINTSRLIGAALRHIFAYAKGEDRDPETGLHHIAHAMCCCMFIIGMPHYISGQDDRNTKERKNG